MTMVTLSTCLLTISTLTAIEKVTISDLWIHIQQDYTIEEKYGLLVNLSVHFVLSGETYQALVIYEKLLDMYSRLQTDNIECSDVWTSDFIHGLYMNCSIAYKTVGSYDKALHYAKLYLQNMSAENFVGMCVRV